MKILISLIVILNCFIFYSSCTKTESATNSGTNTTTTQIVPIPPVDLSASDTSINSVKLKWVDKSTNETGFKIERKTDLTSFSVVGNTGKDITAFIDSGLATNTKYTYRVYSYNSVGPSPTYSNEITITTLIPNAPEVKTSEANSVTFYSATYGGDVIFEGRSSVTSKGLVYSKSPNPDVKTGIVISKGTGMGSFSHKIVGLEPSTKYYVRAFATNSFQTSYGVEFSFTTLDRPTSGIGSIGKGGGIVFYDKGLYTTDKDLGSWRYLEVRGIPNVPGLSNIGFAWGCSPSSSGATYSGLGLGIINQNNIKNTCPSPFTYKVGNNTVTRYTWAAYVDSVSSGGYSDWYIPSLFEVQTFYNALIVPGIMPTGGTLATSTQQDDSNFKVITINGGPGPDNSFGYTPKLVGTAANTWFMIRAF